MFEDNLNILYNILIIIIHNRGNWGRLKSKIQIMLMINKGLNLSLNITQFVIKARDKWNGSELTQTDERGSV